jgi:hypothetical protein
LLSSKGKTNQLTPTIANLALNLYNMQVFHAQYQPTDRPTEDRIAVAQPQTPTDTRIAVGVFDGPWAIFNAVQEQ